MASASLKCAVRDKLGSRDARKLRRGGWLPASLQGEGEKPNVNLRFSLEEFIASRRQHVHLFDLEFADEVQSAVVREVQWDALGDHIIHVDFKRVTRGVATESEVPLEFYGQVKDGVLTHNVTHITISSIPSLIPDSIEVNVTDLVTGDHIHVSGLALPEGVSLAVPANLEIAVVTAVRGPMAEEVPVEEVEPIVEGEEPKAEEPEAEQEE